MFTFSQQLYQKQKRRYKYCRKWICTFRD